MGRATNKWVLRALAGVLMLGLLAAGCAPAEDPDDDTDAAAEPTPAEGNDVEPADDEEPEDFGEEVTLTFGHPFPATDPIQVTVWEPWVEEVREATGGTVNIEIHAGGALAPPPQVYENTVAGAQDIGWTMPGYTAGRFPITQIIEAPFTFGDAVEGTEVAWELWEAFPEFQEEYGDVKVLAIWAMDTGDFFTRDRPVETLEDVAGLTIRSPAPLQGEALEAMGASAVGMPAPDIYDSVERGVIDGYFLANSATRVFDLGPTTSYRTACNCYTGAFVLVMNQGQWDSLSPAQQEAIDSLTGRDLALQVAAEHQAMGDEVEAEYWPANDVETIELSDEEFDRWREAVQPVFDGWIEEREAEGIPGQQMADMLFELTGVN
jgi:TRAP-type transport system periplasmic protein